MGVCSSVDSQQEKFYILAYKMASYGRLNDLISVVESNHLRLDYRISYEQKKADRKLAGVAGMNMLHIAAAHGHYSIVEWIMQKADDPTKFHMIISKANDGGTALQLAAQNGHTKIVHLLIRSGANVNCALPMSGTTPLMIASERGLLRVVRALVENGARLNTCYKVSKMTALGAASYCGQAAVVEYLLTAGADYQWKDEAGRTPQEVAGLSSICTFRAKKETQAVFERFYESINATSSLIVPHHLKAIQEDERERFHEMSTRSNSEVEED